MQKILTNLRLAGCLLAFVVGGFKLVRVRFNLFFGYVDRMLNQNFDSSEHVPFKNVVLSGVLMTIEKFCPVNFSAKSTSTHVDIWIRLWGTVPGCKISVFILD